VEGEVHPVDGREHPLAVPGRVRGLALDAVAHEVGHIGDPFHHMAVTIHYGIIVIRHGCLPNRLRNPNAALLSAIETTRFRVSRRDTGH